MMSDLAVPPGTNTLHAGSSSTLSADSGAYSKKSIDSAARPLAALSEHNLVEDAEAYAKEHGLEEYLDILKKGALVARNPRNFEQMAILTAEEKDVLRRDEERPWSQPWMLYYLVGMCSLAAALQGVRHVFSPDA